MISKNLNLIYIICSLIHIFISYEASVNSLNPQILHKYPINSRYSQFSHNNPRNNFQLHAKKKKEIPKTPEFSRIVNVAQIGSKRKVLCKLLAKENERQLLAERYEIQGLSYFAGTVL